MSPEQRAADLYELWSKRWNDDWCLNPDEFDALVAAIRAAENEALERAAAALDKANEVCGNRDGICLFCAQRRRDARVIRSLKSKPPEGK